MYFVWIPKKIKCIDYISKLENNLHSTSLQIAEEFVVNHKPDRNHIKFIGFVLKQSIWYPYWFK